MAIYKGTISGTGDKDTRENEITADDLAVLRNFITGHTYGVIENYKNIEIQNSHHDLYCYKDENSNNVLHLTDGMAFAYGYFAYSKAIDISILLPAVEQYHLIYLEIDKSEVPNVCTIKVKNNMSNPYINATTFRQDQLSTVKTGIFQLPLWQVHINNTGIQELNDLRTLKKSILNVKHSDTANKINLNGIIQNNVTAITQDISINTNLIATTKFTQMLIQKAINEGLPEQIYYDVTYGGVLGWGSDADVEFNCDYGTATAGTKVTFTAVCIAAERVISGVDVVADLGGTVNVIDEGNDTYSFIMPADNVNIRIYVLNKE